MQESRDRNHNDQEKEPIPSREDVVTPSWCEQGKNVRYAGSVCANLAPSHVSRLSEVEDRLECPVFAACVSETAYT